MGSGLGDGGIVVGSDSVVGEEVMIGSSGCVCVGVISDGGLQAAANSTMQLNTTIKGTAKDVVWLCMIAPQMDMLAVSQGVREMIDRLNSSDDGALPALSCCGPG